MIPKLRPIFFNPQMEDMMLGLELLQNDCGWMRGEADSQDSEDSAVSNTSADT